MDMHNVGGTPGGTRTFFLGLVMVIVGGYLLFDHVQVHGGFWRWRGIGGYGSSFGITLIPLLFGIGILFVNGRSLVGRLLTAGGFLVILVGIIANLDIHFRQTSLFNTLVMLVLLVGGTGLVVRSVLPMGQPHTPAPRDPRDPRRTDED
ncbi:MAG: hypothetical protein M3619_17855 [Myxococcota bacterium]|nr:hypothetical protein [Myxococcota bacterium]